MRTFDPKTLSIKERHGLLLGAVGPRPIAWVSTVDANGNPNLAPFSFFNVFSSNPPVLIFSPARSGRTNTTKHTYDNAKVVPEAVVNIVNHDLVERMVISSLEYPQGVSEFEKAGLTMIASDSVAPPRVKESPAQFECKVLEIKELGTEGAAGNLIICEVVKMHYQDEIFDADGRIDQEKIDLVGRLGGAYYTRAHGDSLFEVKSNPMNTIVGYDSIPEFVQNSSLLSASDIAALVNADKLPDETEVNDFKLEFLDEVFMELMDRPDELGQALLEKTKSYISDERINEAWCTILSFNP